MRKLILILTICCAGATRAQQLPMNLWYDREAIYFEESLPIGNGQISATVYGGADTDSLQLNDMTLWSGKPWDRNRNADAHRWIPQIREALFREDYKTADSLQLKMQGPDAEWYEPVGTLVMNDIHSKDGKAENYRRMLDIDRAIASVSYDRNGVHYEREYFVSYPNRVIVIHLKASQPAALSMAVNLKSLLPSEVKGRGNNQLLMRGHATGDATDAMKFCTLVQVDCDKQGRWGTDDDGNLFIMQATEATLYIANETSFNGFDKHPVAEGRDIEALIEQDAKDIARLDYNKVKATHIADYQQFYNRLTLSIDGAVADDRVPTDKQLLNYTDNHESNAYLETLYMQYGRYLLITSSRTPSVPATLQGIWNPYVRAPWHSGYTTNINLEENYWPAEVANLSELTMPLITFIQNLAQTGAYAARNYYGIVDGWCASHNSDIWAAANPVQGMPLWANWNLSGAWLCMSLWEHYLYTQDEAYLRDVAYPLMRGAANFCMQWLVENPHKPQELFTAPSTSPENMYKTFEGYSGCTCYGGTADLAIIRELFINTLQAINVLSADPKVADDSQFGSQIAESLSRLHPYTIGHEGDLDEWYYDWDDWDPKHRHQSHLIGLYPGRHISLAKTPRTARAAEQTLIQKGNETTGWSTGWRINLWARLHDADHAYLLFRKLLTYVSPDNYDGPDKRSSGGTYPNLFDAHAPFQIDGNFGGTAGVCEMLIQSDLQIDSPQAAAYIELLPALPKAWSSGEVHGLKARGGYTVDMKWSDSKVVSATVTAGRSGRVVVAMNGQSHEYTLKKGKTIHIK